MAMTTNLLETHIVQFHEATFEWWYGARENIPSKEPKLSSFVRGYKRLRLEKFLEETSDGARESWIKCNIVNSTM
ncbi:hypothetical protein V1477_001522 [Vespula maculifrons]|uniref:Uncharacterized protein n=1 Tax=Vespula maculifrons TaxID=7453 RepID=A0ABD2D027_VESMC